jgi:hypothetical protein
VFYTVSRGRIGFSEVYVDFSEHEPQMWDGLGAQFIDYLGEVNAELRKAGMKEIKAKET